MQARRMKKLVICCDGTWNRLDNRNVTNVVRMAEAASSRSAEGATQIVYYDEGVGSGSAVIPHVDRFLGGAFGSGLMTKVEHAYRFLVFNYDPGDEIYIFGFSRGAFTARSLAGLIRNCGILEQRQARRIGEAIALYRARGEDCHPDADASCEFRASASPATYLNERDLEWRRRKPDFRAQDCTRLRLRYLGIWDTVGALGVPSHLVFAGMFNRGHRFHDTCLSSTVESARHALALDEFRRSFEPAMWTNLDILNEAARNAGAGEAIYRQHWFPGDHSSVGGGGIEEGLSSGAFGWIAQGAQEAGLALDTDALAAVAALADHRASLLSSPAKRVSKESFMQKRPRAGPHLIEDVAEPARARWREPAEALPGKALYRPESLARVAGSMPG
jgi:uncharacterized protein (DUF2235 family)